MVTTLEVKNGLVKEAPLTMLFDELAKLFKMKNSIS